MKLLIYFVIIAMSVSISFSGGKPCCNKKKGKNAVSCKFNKVTTIGADKDAVEKLTSETIDENKNSYKCSTDAGNQNAKCAKEPWWKFWAKKSNNNCPCKQSEVVEVSTTSGG